MEVLPDATSECQPFGVLGWKVHDVKRWWEHTKEWHESEHKIPWTDTAFFMRLRRLGCHALNKAPAPAKTGFDYGLKRTDVTNHDYEFMTDMWDKYNCLLKMGVKRTGTALEDESS